MFNYKRIGAWIGATMVCAAVGLYAATLKDSGHMKEKQCVSCHLAGTQTSAESASKLVASEEALCRDCHPNSVRASHPSGFAPRRALPAAFPLDWKGDLTCSTCHLVHNPKATRTRGAGDARALCMACHDAAFFASMKEGGGSIVQSGHLGSGIRLGTAAMDSYSLQCLGCHSGEWAGNPGMVVDRNGISRHGSGAANHPIGRIYREAERFGGYRPQALLSKKVWLPEGKVGCVSCHETYKKQHGKLVMSNRGSALCMECHDI